MKEKKEPNVPKRRKLIAGKQRCDRCEQKNPPIHECSWPLSRGNNESFWMDLCLPCYQAIEAHFNSGKAVGGFGELLK